MQQELRKNILEAAFYVGLMALCLAVIVSTIGLPESLREPLGSSAVPRGISVLIAAFSAFLLGQTLRRIRKLRQAASTSPESEAPAVSGHPVLKTCVIIAAYAALLTWPVIPSVITTPLFLFILIMALSERTTKNICWAAGLAIVFGAGLHYLFKHYLFVNLP